MAITARAANNGTFVPPNTSFVCNLPAATAVGDEMVLVVCAYSGGGGAQPANTPAGWSLLTSTSGFSFGVSTATVSVFTRRAAGAETTVTVTTPVSEFLNYEAFGFVGTDATVPVESGTLAQIPSAVTAACPNVSTLTNNAAVVVLTVNQTAGGEAITVIPAGTSVLAGIIDGGGNIENVGAWKTQAAAGAVGALTWTYGNHTPTPTIITGTVVLRASGEIPVFRPKGGPASIFAVAAMGKGLRLGFGQGKGGGQGKGQGGGPGGQHPPPSPPPTPPPVAPPPGPPPIGSTKAHRKAASDIRRRRGV
jgi:hypothetical protein